MNIQSQKKKDIKTKKIWKKDKEMKIWQKIAKYEKRLSSNLFFDMI